MTANGWIQIALYCALIILFVKPFGAFMARVFEGERTLLWPVLRPVERGVYWCCGVDEKQEQHWLTYAVAMLLFSVAGFVTLYALQRFRPCCRSTRRANRPSSRAWPSTPRSASSPTPTGRAMAARRR